MEEGPSRKGPTATPFPSYVQGRTGIRSSSLGVRADSAARGPVLALGIAEPIPAKAWKRESPPSLWVQYLCCRGMRISRIEASRPPVLGKPVGKRHGREVHS